MKQVMFSRFGVQVFEENGEYWIRYDGGQIVVQMREDRITAAEAAKAGLSEDAAYEVIIAAQNRGKRTA